MKLLNHAPFITKQIDRRTKTHRKKILWNDHQKIAKGKEKLHILLGITSNWYLLMENLIGLCFNMELHEVTRNYYDATNGLIIRAP